MTNDAWNKIIVSGSTGGDPDYSVRVNGSNVGSMNETGTPSATVSPYPLGIGVGGGAFYSTDAKFHEIIIYNRELTLTEVQKLEYYLQTMYNI